VFRYYLKWARGLSQTPWLIDDEQHGDGSVSGLIEGVLGPHLRASSLKFIAAGREDMDVRMLGQPPHNLTSFINTMA
jgi:tRNA pseudouridine synthase 10